jgi:hypothetical protein
MIGERVIIGPATVEVVSAEDAEKADIVVCMRLGASTPFTDNLVGTCNDCGHPIIFRPYAPKKPTKVCLECLAVRTEAGRA